MRLGPALDDDDAEVLDQQRHACSGLGPGWAWAWVLGVGFGSGFVWSEGEGWRRCAGRAPAKWSRPYISPTSPPHLPHISPTSPLHRAPVRWFCCALMSIL